MQPETDAPMDLQEGGRTFRDRVIHPWMFRAYMLAKMPALGVTGTYLADIDTRRCEAVVPFGWGTENLFGRMFDSAVVAAAETASLALLVLHVRNQSAELTAELTELSAEIDAPPPEDLRVRCENGHRYADFVCRAKSGPPRESAFSAVVESERGEAFYEIEFCWQLRSRA